VTFKQPFAIGKYEVTFEEYEVFANATGRDRPDEGGSGRGRTPIRNVSWGDAKAYAIWLSEHTNKPYRLPSESEWEYAARAGSTTRYWWGNDIGTNQANCSGCDSSWDLKHAPVGEFPANAFGLHDVHGNIVEWVEDCWHYSYEGAPNDGSAWLNTDGAECDQRAARGGSWYWHTPNDLRSANRFWDYSHAVLINVGFRLAQDLPN